MTLTSSLKRNILLLILLAISALFTLASVLHHSITEERSTPVESESENNPLLASPYLEDYDYIEWQTDLDSLLGSLSVREKIAQLMIVWAHGTYQADDSERFSNMLELVKKHQVGGLMFARGNIYDQATVTNRLQSVSKIPLWVTQDMEYGAAMRIDGTTRIVPAMGVAATGNERNAWYKGLITASEAKAVGVHQIFAPVVDINNNPDNPVINTRSFSEDPQTVARFADAFILGAQSTGVVATAKHFPGHGDTRVDSHYALPVIRHDWARVSSVELVPFRSAIQSGVGSIMSAHIDFPLLTGRQQSPGTLDRRIMHDILRDSLRFQGIIVTDALNMRGITDHAEPGEAVISAIQAGADFLLAPTQVSMALDQAELAVKRGELSEEQLDAAVRRVLTLKRRHGLFTHKGLVNIDEISAVINNRTNRAHSDRIARESITLLKNRGQILPISPKDNRQIHIISVTNAREDQSGQPLARAIGTYQNRVTHSSVDARSTADEINRAVRLAGQADVVVLAMHTTVGGKLDSGHPARNHNLFNRLRDIRPPVVGIIFGNPYTIDTIAFADAHILAWASTQNQFSAVASALSGMSTINGRLPTALPRMYERGTGFYLPQRYLRADLPESAGLSTDSLNRINDVLSQAIRDKVFPGAAVAVVRNGVLAWSSAHGYHDYERARAVRNDDIFDLASISKVMGTTLAVMRLVDEGKLELETRVSEFFSEFQDGDKAKVTIRQLLEHTSGMRAFRIYVDELRTRDEIVQAILNEELINPPGEIYVYSDLGMITLALIVEKITGTDLNSYMQRTFYEPLGLRETMYNPWKKGAQFIARSLPTEKDTIYRNKEIRGYVHDERAYFLDGIAGHAGLFSSSRDLAVLVQMILNKGEYGGTRYLSEAVIDTFSARQPPLNRRGLGFDLRTLEGFSSAGQFAGERTFGHLGFTGTSFWIDPDTGTGVILLTNRTFPHRDQSGGIGSVRAEISDIVFSSYLQ